MIRFCDLFQSAIHAFKSSINFLFLEMQNQLKNELHDVLSGKSKIRFGAIIQTIANYLRNSSETSSIVENPKHFKKQEAKRLEIYISENNLWITDIDFSQSVNEGADYYLAV